MRRITLGNIIIKNARELATSSGTGAKFGAEMKDLKVIHDGAVAIKDGKIVSVGTTEEVLNSVDVSEYEVIDATGKTVLPGFVDSHTHFVFGGYRDDEFNWRLEGVPYMEIMNRGGGIVNSVRDTRETSEEELYEIGLKRMDSMMAFGVTTVEGKSGYGLDTETELKQLRVMKKLNENHPLDVVRTFMGAHATSVEYKGDTDAFVDYLIEDSLPKAIEDDLSEFCDIFTEENVFSIEQSRKLLTAARDMGYKLKMHADEIVQFGGSELAAELKTFSADHLLAASDKGLLAMRDAGVVATLLPLTAFSLKAEYARARFMIDNGLAVAVSTDFNPGSCYSNSMPLLIALSTIYMGMTVEETITAITLNAAQAIDRADTIGSLEVGKNGDVIILDAPSYKHLSYHFGVNLVETVVKNGSVIYSK